MAAYLVGGGTFGNYAVCPTPDDASMARAAWPDVPRYQESEIALIGRLCRVCTPEEQETSLLAIAACKRIMVGSVITEMLGLKRRESAFDRLAA